MRILICGLLIANIFTALGRRARTTPAGVSFGSGSIHCACHGIQLREPVVRPEHMHFPSYPSRTTCGSSGIGLSEQKGSRNIRDSLGRNHASRRAICSPMRLSTGSQREDDIGGCDMTNGGLNCRHEPCLPLVKMHAKWTPDTATIATSKSNVEDRHCHVPIVDSLSHVSCHTTMDER